MKSYEEINAKIESKRAVVLTAEEIIDYVEKKGLEEAAREVDVVTTATFGLMCSSGCFLNFGHSKPRMRMTQAWIDDVEAYCGIAAEKRSRKSLLSRRVPLWGRARDRKARGR
jgi:uncharacterized protein (DUF39 family)